MSNIKNIDDVIVALSTPIGKGAIGIVRLSGKGAIEIIESSFQPKSSAQMEPFKLTLGHILGPKGEKIDEVMVSIMKGPKSYTKEDMVEVNSHGGPFIVQKIVALFLEKGARMAQPGEFTKRAFLNGRIDLTQAESTLDLIDVESSKSLESSLGDMEGRIRDKVLSLRSNILDILAQTQVVVDYPEEVEEYSSPKLKESAIQIYESLNRIVESYEMGKKIKGGVRVAIVGKPNVGKSSILNRLLMSDRAIVTDIPGTTRDLIEESIFINGLLVLLIDTAGLREAEDGVERIGIELSKKSMENADIILFVSDSSRDLDDEDRKVMKLLEGKRYIFVLNKGDLKRKAYSSNQEFQEDITISAREDEDLNNLKDLIYDRAMEGINIGNSEDLVLTNTRHKNLFKRSAHFLGRFIKDLGSVPENVASINLEMAADSLSEIIGEITNEDILDNIFSNFCVGK